MDNRQLLIFGTGLSSAKEYGELLKICDTVVSNGIRSFDTAPSYGTEKIVGKIVRELSESHNIPRENFFIQTKIDPPQMMEGRAAIQNHVQKTLSDMQLEYFDALLIHWPLPECFDETWEELLTLKQKGIACRIGVCNLKERQIRDLLKRGKVLPDILQIERNPLNTCEKVISVCSENAIAVQAYSPLCKMHPKLKNSKRLDELSRKYCVDIGALILRWHIDTGVTPIFTSKNLERIKQYSQISAFRLADEDIKSISMLNENYKIYLESWLCPGF